MKINWLTIKDFRGFRNCEITFPKNSNAIVFIGINGAGKSAILDAISILLNVLVKEIRDQKFLRLSMSNDFNQDDINFNAENYKIQVGFSSKDRDSKNDFISINYAISLIYKANSTGSYRQYINKIKSSISKNSLSNLPIFIHYQVNRNTVVNNSREEKDRYTRGYKSDQFYAYEYAFDKSINSFNEFSKWFREEEDFENQEQIRLKDFEYRNKRLEVIRESISTFLNKFEFAKFSDLMVERKRASSKRNNLNEETITSSLMILKDGQKFKFSQLSSGEKMMLSLVVDIARRLAIANPSLENKLEGEGIVLIDEVDLHLHPQWQRKLLPALTHTFPNIQFIVTTHSPQVLSHVSKESVFLLEDNKISDREIYTEGRDSNSILQDVFHVPKYAEEYEKELDEIYHLIDSYDEKNALELLKKLKEKRGENDLEVMRMQSYIDLL